MNSITCRINTEAEMVIFASQIARKTPTRAIIFLQGCLGAGKTTFVRGFMRALGYQDKVKSPTFALVEPYQVQNQKIFHFDLYRLKQAAELRAIGIEEYFSNEAIFLIEWPEKGESLLPSADLLVNIVMVGEQRKIDLEAKSIIGKAIIKEGIANDKKA